MYSGLERWSDNNASFQNLEPNKCEGWEWCVWGDATVPKPRFVPLDHILASGFRLPDDTTPSK